MLLKSKKLFITFTGIGVILLGILSLSSATLSSQLAKFSQIKDGMNVCFGRVTETFRAQASDGAPEVVSGPYTALTEECFADLKEMLSEEKGKFFSNQQMLMNSVLTDVYWLHRLGADQAKSDESAQRFEKIEQFRLNLESDLAKRVGAISSSLLYLKWALALVLSAAVCCLVLDYAQRRKLRLQNERYELSAVDLRQKEKVESTIHQASLLLQEALQFNQLNECSLLCEEVISKQQEEIRWSAEERQIIVELEPDLEIELELEEELIEDNWCDNFMPEETPEHLRQVVQQSAAKEEQVVEVSALRPTVCVEEALESILNHFQPQFSAHQIFVDIRGKLNLKADISQEDFEQIIFGVLNSAIIRMSSSSTKNHLVIALDEVDQQIELNFFDNGPALASDDMNLSVAKELIDEFNGKLFWENSDDIGRHICCRLNGSKQLEVAAETRRTVSVTKTTKRQWLQSMQQANC